MKAKEYFEKYEAGLTDGNEENGNTAIADFLTELVQEIETIKKVRHVQCDRGFLPILKEQNDKYKAVVRMFVKKYGASPIKPEGFEMILEKNFPGMDVVGKMKNPRAPARKVDTHTREAGDA